MPGCTGAALQMVEVSDALGFDSVTLPAPKLNCYLKAIPANAGARILKEAPPKEFDLIGTPGVPGKIVLSTFTKTLLISSKGINCARPILTFCLLYVSVLGD